MKIFKFKNILDFHSYMNKQYNILITLITIFFLSFIWLTNIDFIKLFNWVKIHNLKIDYIVLLGWELICSLIIILMSTLILIYSLDYIKNTIDFNLFYIYMLLFVISIILLVIGGNLAVLLIGWEGVGVMSYLLINYWNLRIESNKSSLKALMLNKIGDFCIIFSSILLYNLLLTFNNIIINNLSLYYMQETINIYFFELSHIGFLAFLLLIGAISKSAQFLFSMWLPDAMEGPTPVSALIHSSTMVAAGYILLLKYSLIFQASWYNLLLILLIGLITNLLATFITLTTTDIKNTLANSTTAQISYMFFLFGYGYPIFSFLQFISHAFYKALLFMGFGGLIHQVKNNQDSRIFITNYLYNPILYTCLFIALINFISIPGYISHYSKINLLNLTTTVNYGFQYGIWIITEYSQIINFLAGLTLFFSILNFNNNIKISKNFLHINHSWEVSNLFSLFSILILTLGCLILGSFLLKFSYIYIYYFLNNLNYINLNDLYYSNLNISRYLFINIFIISYIYMYIFKSFTSFNYNQVSNINNLNLDKLLNKNLKFIYFLAIKINFLFNNKFMMPSTYLKYLNF